MDNLPEDLIETPVVNNQGEMPNDLVETPVNIPSFKVLDNDTGDVYNMPATMDEIDFNYAKGTQIDKINPNSFFGKVQVAPNYNDEQLEEIIQLDAAPEVDKGWRISHVAEDKDEEKKEHRVNMLASANELLAFIFTGDKDKAKQAKESVERFENLTLGGLSGAIGDKARQLNFIKSGYYDYAKRMKEYEQTGNVPTPFKSREDYENHLNTAKEKALTLRSESDKFWNNLEEMYKEEDLSLAEQTWAGLLRSSPDLAISMAAAYITKNPLVGGVVGGGLAYPAQFINTFDKAIKEGKSYEQAFLASRASGMTSSIINTAGGYILGKVSKIPQIKRIADKVKTAAVDKIRSGQAISGAVSTPLAVAKGGLVEGTEELIEYSSVVGVENAFDLNTDWNLEEALLSFTIGSLSGGVVSGVGAYNYNQQIYSLNEAIKQEVSKTNPQLEEQSIQKVSNTISETFFQTGSDVELADSLNSIIAKTNAPDIKPTAKQVKLRKQMKDKIQKRFKLSDEEMAVIDKVANRAYEITKGYNAALDHYSNLLEVLNLPEADKASRSIMLASIDTASALRNNSTVEQEIEKRGLKIQKGEIEKQTYRSDGKSLDRHENIGTFVNEKVKIVESSNTRTSTQEIERLIKNIKPEDDIRLIRDNAKDRWILGESLNRNHKDMYLDLSENKMAALQEYNEQRNLDERGSNLYNFILQGYKGGDYKSRIDAVDQAYSEAFVIPKNEKEGAILFVKRAESAEIAGLGNVIKNAPLVSVMKNTITPPKDVIKAQYDQANKLMTVFEKGDISSFIHETTHAFERDLAENAQTPESKELLNEIYNLLGVKDGKPTTEQIEEWARLNEAFFYTGKTPNRTMKQASENFRDWLKYIYNDVQELGVKPSKEVDKLIRKIYGGRQLDTVLGIGEQILQKQIKEKTITKKDVGKKIKHILDVTKPRKDNGKLVGRFPDKKVNDFFDSTRKTLATKKDEAVVKITQNLIDIQQGMDEGLDVSDLVWENKLLSIAANKADLSMTAEVYNALAETYNEGRVGERVKREARKLHRDKIITNAKNVLFQGKGKNWRQESSRAKQALRRSGILYQGWNGILDTLSMFDKSSKVGYSQLYRDLNVYQEETAMNTGIREDSEKLGELLSKALGTGKSISRYINSTSKEKILLEWGENSKKFTRGQLIDLYMKSKDPETKDIMAKDKVLQYNDEFLARVEENLTNEDVAVANALFEFYRQNYDKVNKFYEDKYGISLGKNENYSPRSMQSQNIDVRNGDLRSGASVSSFKQRTAKGGQVKVKDAFQVFADYITSTNHYIAFSDKLQDLNAVFAEPEIRNMIENTFGKPMNNVIRREISRFATNNQKFLEVYDGILSKVRSNYVASVLGGKPSIAVKQIVSFPAYLEKMSLGDFVTSVAEFASNPKKAMEILSESEYMKNRGFDVTQDFQKISKSETFKKFATKKGFRDFLMMNVELGDKGAIYIGGYALYRTEYNKNISRGMDEKSAKIKALDTVSRYTNATQQSSYMSEQSALQSNAYTNLFTMFQTAQNQYLRKEIGAIRGLATGRMGVKEAVKVLGIYHFLLPMLFQYVSDFGRWDWDNQKRAMLLGSFNGAYVLSSLLETGANWIATGEMNRHDTRFQDVVPVWTVVEEWSKMVEAFADLDFDDITLDDVGGVLKQSAKAVGYGVGVPMKWATDVATNLPEYIEEGEYWKALGLTLGWTPWALND